MLYVYTGDGKGKTSAALGLVMRAYGAGLNCAVIFFDKNPDYCNELTALKELGIRSYVFGVNRILDGGVFRAGNTEEDLFETAKAVDMAWQILREGQADVLILDEILNAVRLEQVPLAEVGKIVEAWPQEKYLVLTGRGLPDDLREKAHLISEIQAIKHPLADEGIFAIKGIDY